MRFCLKAPPKFERRKQNSSFPHPRNLWQKLLSRSKWVWLPFETSQRQGIELEIKEGKSQQRAALHLKKDITKVSVREYSVSDVIYPLFWRVFDYWRVIGGREPINQTRGKEKKGWAPLSLEWIAPSLLLSHLCVKMKRIMCFSLFWIQNFVSLWMMWLFEVNRSEWKPIYIETATMMRSVLKRARFLLLMLFW